MSDDIAEQVAARWDDVAKRRRAAMNKEYSDVLNSNFNFRCNDELKEDFKQLCKANQTSPTTVLKRYMLDCIRNGRVA